MNKLFKITFVFLFSFLTFAQAMEVEQVQAPYPGFLFRPKDKRTYPAIIMLHGSEGGNGDYWFKSENTGLKAGIPMKAKEFAQMGFVVYALCYFDCRKQPGYKNYPPDELINVDILEITYRAMIWLQASPLVRGRNVSIMGFSRGAEQVLFLESVLTFLKKTNPQMVLPTKMISASPFQETVSGIPLWWAKKAKETGVQPPVNFNLPAWKFLGKSVIGGFKIDISQTQIPTLISGFSIDPVWGNASLQPYRNQFPPSKQLPLTMKLGDLAKDKMATLPPRLPLITVLEFQNEGHSTPKDPEERGFFVGLSLKFLQQP